jgi:hypothetical protein
MEAGMTYLQKKCLILGLLILFLCAYLFQSYFLLNWDISWLLIAAQRLMRGGSYSKDFFEINPPLILYLYIPPLIISKFLSINLIWGFRIYIFLLSALSFWLCYRLRKNIFSPDENHLQPFFYLAIAFIFLIIPFHQFGQREHLLVIFTLPYFLTVAARQEKGKISTSLALLIGCFAALGFGLKPYFLFAFIFTELYFMLQTRAFFSWLRPETMSLLFILMLYGLSIFLFHRDYLYLVAPEAYRFYYTTVKLNWRELLFHPGIFFCFWVILLYFCIAQKKLSRVLFCGLLGFLLAYFIQKTNWSYHYLPALSFATLLAILEIYFFATNHHHTFKEKLFVALLSSILCFLLITESIHSIREGLSYKKSHTPLISFMKNHLQNKSSSIFSTSVRDIFPAISYANVDFVSRFAGLGWIPFVIKQDPTNKNFFINMITDDLNQKKPDYVFVDIQDYKPYLGYLAFDFISFFSQDVNFKKAWQSYHYLTTIEYSDLSTKKSHWDLYIPPNHSIVPTENFKNPTVILLGSQKNRIAYFVVKQKLLRAQSIKLFRHLILSDEEISALTNQIGLISKNKLTQQIINKSLNLPSYKFAIYQRKKK